MTPFRVVLLGLGTVGRPVAERLVTDADALASRAGGRRLELVGVSVRALPRLAGLALPPNAVVATDVGSLVRPRDVDCVVELLGGLEPAGALVRQALGAGMAVVTANKHLLAEAGADLETLAREAGARLRFEAAVGGGTPILAMIADDLSAMRIERVRGVINGTTNWILDMVEQEGMTAPEALAAAQAAGYTEADPTLDTEGHDAAHKLVILSRLAFGRWIHTADVARISTEAPGAGAPGISRVSAADVRAAADRGQRIRLVAEATRHEDRITASVLPRFLGLDDPLAAARGVTNVVELEGPPLGRVVLSGPGAGGPATAAAVLADLVRLARGDGSTWGGETP